MLLITRRRGESLKIGDEVEITVTGFRPGAVRIGVRAPRNVTVIRTELLKVPTNGARHTATVGEEHDD